MQRAPNTGISPFKVQPSGWRARDPFDYQRVGAQLGQTLCIQTKVMASAATLLFHLANGFQDQSALTVSCKLPKVKDLKEETCG